MNFVAVSEVLHLAIQETIFEIIVAIANIRGVFDHGDSVLYAFKNYIAFAILLPATHTMYPRRLIPSLMSIV
ncbi:MAG: hypothetical protein IPM25_09105 [Chloracidobacterium sp.]|nr:hypothetical protein [Chloracidobacterium sp.]